MTVEGIFSFRGKRNQNQHSPQAADESDMPDRIALGQQLHRSAHQGEKQGSPHHQQRAGHTAQGLGSADAMFQSRHELYLSRSAPGRIARRFF